MPFPIHTGDTLGAVLKLASELLGDADPAAPNVRWTVSELVGYASEALRQILSLRPEAFAYTTEIPLQVGMLQQLPKDYQTLVTASECVNGAKTTPVTEADYKYARLLKKAVRSADFDGDPLDDYAVRTFTRHPVDDTIFLVNPPFPFGCRARIRATLILRAKKLELEDVARPIPIRPEYQPQVLDWIMHRALAKDHESATAREQSKVHLDAFNASLDAATKAHARLHEEAEDEEPGTNDQQTAHQGRRMR